MLKTPATRLSLGLTLLTLSILSLGDLIGITPDPIGEALQFRKRFSESLAIQLSHAAGQRDFAAMRNTLDAVVERNADVLSAAMRFSDGTPLLEAGDHSRHWKADSDDVSTLTHVQVPVFRGSSRVATVEVLFDAPAGALMGILGNPFLRMLAFMGLAGFLANLLFLRKTLTHLDPSAVVPTRVKYTLDLLTEGVVLVDENERIVLANSSFKEKFFPSGISPVGRKLAEFNWYEREAKGRPRLLPWKESMRTGDIQCAASLSLMGPSKKEHTFTVNSCPIFDDREKIRGLIVTFDDVTELQSKNSQLVKTVMLLERTRDEVSQKNRQLKHTNLRIEAKVIERTEALRTAKDKAEASDQAKSAFLANISHELRTPMHAILSFSEFGIKKKGKSPEKISTYFEMINKSGTSLLSLVNDLLDLSKFQAGRMTCDPQRNDLKEVVESVLKETSGLIEAKGVRVDFLNPEGHAMAVFDGDRVTQLVRNLLSNAIKFSEERKSITVELSEGEMDVHGESVPSLELRVIDEGPGVPEDQLEKIFEPFFQSERTYSGAGGTGLGLAICRQIVDAHGGWLRAANRPEGGSVFTFAIPRVPVSVKMETDDVVPA